MLDVIEQLKGYGEQLETSFEPVTTTVPIRQQRQRRGGLVPFLVGAVAVLALIGGVAIFFDGSGSRIPAFAGEEVSFRTILDYPSPGEGLSSGTVEVRYEASTGAFAIEVIDHQPGEIDESFGSGPGSFLIFDGEVTTVGVAEDQITFVASVGELNRSGLGEYVWEAYWTEKCKDAQPLDGPILAGRTSIRASCSDGGTEWNLWVDAETGLMLKVDGPIEPRFDGFLSTEVGFEVVAVDYNPVFSSEDFAPELSAEQEDFVESTAARAEMVAALPPFRARVNREFRADAPGTVTTVAGAEGEFGTDGGSDERIFWYQPDVGVRYEVIANTLDDGYDSPGSFTVWTTAEQGHYENATNTWFIAEGGDSYTELLELGPPREQLGTECDQIADGTHLGRAVHRYENCLFYGTDVVDRIWIDIDTGLLVLRESDVERYEVLELETEPDFIADWFVFMPPPGSDEVGTNPWAGLRFGPGNEVPVFVGSYLDGTTFDLESLRGQPTLIYLWASWCPLDTCRIPEAQQLHDLYGDTVNVIAFASRDDPASVLRVLDELDLSLPIALCEPDCKPDDPGPP